MSKYDPLSHRLAAHPADEWRASFSELESVLGFPLPKAAHAGRAWWTDPDRTHSRAWTAQGWTVGDVDHAAERVVFRRGAASGVALVQAAGLQPLHEPVSAEVSTAPASEVQPPAMRRAAEAASAQMHAGRALGATAIVTAAAAVVAGLGALLVRRVMRRR